MEMKGGRKNIHGLSIKKTKDVVGGKDGRWKC